MEITKEIIELILTASLVGFAILASGLTVVFGILFWKNADGSIEKIGLLAEKMQLLKFATTILIVLSASLLGLLGIIDPNAVVAVLSAISGYVLGSETAARRDRPTNPPPSES